MQESVVRELLTYLLEPTFCLSIINPGWPDYGAAESIRGYRKNSADLLRLSLGFIGWREISFHFAEIKVFAMPRMGLAARISPFPVIGCVAIGYLTGLCDPTILTLEPVSLNL